MFRVVSISLASLAALALMGFVPFGLLWLTPALPFGALLVVEEILSTWRFRKSLRELTDA